MSIQKQPQILTTIKIVGFTPGDSYQEVTNAPILLGARRYFSSEAELVKCVSATEVITLTSLNGFFW